MGHSTTKEGVGRCYKIVHIFKLVRSARAQELKFVLIVIEWPLIIYPWLLPFFVWFDKWLVLIVLFFFRLWLMVCISNAYGCEFMADKCVISGRQNVNIEGN